MPDWPYRRAFAIVVVALSLSPAAWMAWKYRAMPHLGYMDDDGIYAVTAKSLIPHLRGRPSTHRSIRLKRRWHGADSRPPPGCGQTSARKRGSRPGTAPRPTSIRGCAATLRACRARLFYRDDHAAFLDYFRRLPGFCRANRPGYILAAPDGFRGHLSEAEAAAPRPDLDGRKDLVRLYSAAGHAVYRVEPR